MQACGNCGSLNKKLPDPEVVTGHADQLDWAKQVAVTFECTSGKWSLSLLSMLLSSCESLPACNWCGMTILHAASLCTVDVKDARFRMILTVIYGSRRLGFFWDKLS